MQRVNATLEPLRCIVESPVDTQGIEAMSDYPIPSYSAYIWLSGDRLWLAFPPLVEGGHSHSVPFPATEPGLALALDCLRQRRLGSRSIGEGGSPTRYQVEQDLKRDKHYNELIRAMDGSRETAAIEAKEASAFLEELGL